MISPATIPASSPRWRSGIPAATRSAHIVKEMTSAVPRSGWTATSMHAAPAITSRGLTMPFTVLTRPGSAASSCAA